MQKIAFKVLYRLFLFDNAAYGQSLCAKVTDIRPCPLIFAQYFFCVAILLVPGFRLIGSWVILFCIPIYFDMLHCLL